MITIFGTHMFIFENYNAAKSQRSDVISGQIGRIERALVCPVSMEEPDAAVL